MQYNRLIFVMTLLLGLPLGAQVATGKTGYRALDGAAPIVKAPATNSLLGVTLIGKRLVAVGLHGLILLSDDNGHSWRQAKVPVNLTLTSVWFQDSKTGYAVGHYGVILQSDDGGESWRVDQTGLDVIKAMAAVRDQLIAANSPDAPTQTKVANYFGNQGPNQPFLTVGPCGNGVLAAGSKDMAMFSSDGGQHWQDWTPNIKNPTFRLIYAQFLDNGAPVLVGETGLVVTGDPACGQLAAVPPTNLPTLFGGLALDDGSLFVYGLSGTAAISKDKGATWQQVQLPSGALMSAGLAPAPGDVLLGSLDGQLLLSKDNGATFKLLEMNVPFQIAGMAVAADKDVVVIGNGGVYLLPAQSLN